MHAESMDLMSNFVVKTRRHFTHTPITVLDVGSQSHEGHATYKILFNENYAYTGLDVEPGPNVDLVTVDAYDWKLPSTYDFVISGQAFEHINWPWLTIREIEKALKPGGLAAIIAPTTPLIHRYPVDCWRILPDGWVALAKWANLEMLEVGMNNFGVWRDSFCLLRKPNA